MKKDTEKVVKNNRFYEKAICYIVGVLFIILAILSINMVEFLPGTLIMLALLFFCICYYYRDNKEKQLLVYLLFGLGVGLLIFAVFYTLMETMWYGKKRLYNNAIRYV